MKPRIDRLLKNPQRPQYFYQIYEAENGQVRVEKVFSISQNLIETEFVPEPDIKAWLLMKIWNEWKVFKHKRLHRTKFPTNDPIKTAGGEGGNSGGMNLAKAHDPQPIPPAFPLNVKEDKKDGKG